ncbi:MAG: hypothetical protein IEMM0003_0859 [bacterium]|nr:MAG: hypothetical protein IEMM0003_0859 [bacterium]
MGITNWIIAQGIAFLLLMVILNKILYKPLLTHIRRRDADIDAKHDKASLLAQKVSDFNNRYNNRLNESENNAKALYEKALYEARNQAEKIKEEAKQKAESILKEKRERLWKDVENEKGYIESEASLLVGQIITLIK